jgi:hypothetical protein
MSSPAEKLTQSVESLTISLREFKSFTNTSQNRFSEHISQRLNQLIKKLQKKIQSSKTYLINESSQQLDLEAIWQAYLNNPNPSQDEILRVIQKGLSKRGLESNQEFKNFLERQDDRRAQAKLFRYLYKYLIKILLLAPNPFLDIFWINLALNWAKSFNEPNQEQIDLLESFSRSVPELGLTKLINNEIDFLSNNFANDQVIEKQKVFDILQSRYFIEFNQSDAIYQMLLNKFFTPQFYLYKSNRVKPALDSLLETFCDLNFRNSDVYSRFSNIFDFIYSNPSNLYFDEKEAVINFCKKYLGDPRIDQANWAYLSDNFNSTYKKLSFWFKEQDFDLFFKFVFKNNPDPHGRQAFWKKYLDKIDDIRFFLGTINEYNEFLKLSEETKSSFKPLFNSAGFNAFILKFKLSAGSLYVYDVTATGYACYLYFVDNNNFIKTSSHVRKASKVSKFLSEVFDSESQIQEFNTRSALVQQEITEQISNKSKQPQGFNWRITHDANSSWEKLLSTNLLKFFHIRPSKELSDGYR